jgi:hypothetical protein
VSSDFTIDELYRLIKITDDPYQNCGLDEVLALLAEYIGDERIKVEVDKYIDAYYEDIGLGKGEEND